MKDIYFIRDHNRGVDGTYRWLKEEIEELGEALQYTDKKALEAILKQHLQLRAA